MRLFPDFNQDQNNACVVCTIYVCKFLLKISFKLSVSRSINNIPNIKVE